MASRALLALGLGCSLAAACSGDDGYTPACPELPLFDVGIRSERSTAAVASVRAEAVAAGCLTAPGEPVLDGGAGTGAESAPAADGGAAP